MVEILRLPTGRSGLADCFETLVILIILIPVISAIVKEFLTWDL